MTVFYFVLVISALLVGMYLLVDSKPKTILGWLCIVFAIVIFIASYVDDNKENLDKNSTEQTSCSYTEYECNYEESLEE